MFFCVHKSENAVLLCTQLDFIMHTRVHNEILCTKKYKEAFYGNGEAFFICFGFSHYTLTLVRHKDR